MNRDVTNDDLYHINHGYDGDTGRHYNCPNCSAAFEMMQRGYDVRARQAKNGSNVGDVERFFKNAKLENVNKNLETPPNYDYFMESHSKKKFLNFNAEKQKRQLENEYEKLVLKTAEKAYDNVTKLILSQGEGARGFFVYGHFGNYGDYTTRASAFHSINYVVKNGEVHWYDTQSSRSYKYGGSTEASWKYSSNVKDQYVMRTDNLEFNESIMEAIESR